MAGKPLDAGMPNDDAFVLGCIARSVGHPGRAGVGDSIDRGLILAHTLRQYGYAIVRSPEGRTTDVPITQIETPVMETWPPAMAYAILGDAEARRVLLDAGWREPVDAALTRRAGGDAIPADVRAHLIFDGWDRHPDAPAYWCRLPSWVQEYAAACVAGTDRRLSATPRPPADGDAGAVESACERSWEATHTTLWRHLSADQREEWAVGIRAALALPAPVVERETIARVLFDQRQTAHDFDDAADAAPESDAGTLYSIVHDDADAVIAALSEGRSHG